MRALRAREQSIHRGKYTRSVFLERVEGSRGGKAFEHALVDGTRIDARGKVGEIGKSATLACRDYRFHRLFADAFERRERVNDCVAVDFEIDRRAVHRRRVDLETKSFSLSPEFRQLVSIARVKRHGRGQELDWEIRLHIGGLIGDERISG